MMNNVAPVVLITGGAKRIGNCVAHKLHANNYNVMVHYRSSSSAASELANELNAIRPESAALVQGDLLDINVIPNVIDSTVETFGRIDVLINNASTFYPTPIELVEEEFWNDLVGSNLKVPTFMSKYATKHLREHKGCIINIIDVYAQRPLADHPVYCSAKAGLEMLTKSLARDLAPDIRVNGISPGAILWPANKDSEPDLDKVIQNIPMQRMGDPNDIANAALFLIENADYITGQTITVDGGRSVTI